MLVFFDCEFTSLTPATRLISFGAVAESGESFYREISPIPQEECSDFVHANVLPLFEGNAASCTHQEFLAELSTWLQGFENPELLCDSDWDIYVITLEVGQGSREARVAALPGLPPVPVWLVTDMAGSVQAVIAEGKQQFRLRNPLLSPHHALNDARALALGWRTAAENGAGLVAAARSD